MFPKDGYMSLVSVSTCYHIMPSAASVAPEQPEHWSSFAPDFEHAPKIKRPLLEFYRYKPTSRGMIPSLPTLLPDLIM